MENTKVKQIVADFMSSFEDPFRKDKSGQYFYYSTDKVQGIDLQYYFEALVEDVLSHLPSTEERKTAEEIIIKTFDQFGNFEILEDVVEGFKQDSAQSLMLLREACKEINSKLSEASQQTEAMAQVEYCKNKFRLLDELISTIHHPNNINNPNARFNNE